MAFTATALSGYTLDTVTVETVDENQPIGVNAIQPRGNGVEVIEGENGQFSFKMPPAPVIVKATFIKAVPTAVNGINIERQSRGLRYNMLGQPVGDDYKGIVIEDGIKKIIR